MTTLLIIFPYFQFSLIIALTETWLIIEKVPQFNIQGYNHIPCHRRDRISGGVSLFLQEEFKFSVRPDLSTPLGKEAEAIFIELTTAVHKTKVIFGCIYRPPDSNHNSFINCLITSLIKISSEKKLLIY